MRFLCMMWIISYHSGVPLVSDILKTENYSEEEVEKVAKKHQKTNFSVLVESKLELPIYSIGPYSRRQFFLYFWRNFSLHLHQQIKWTKFQNANKRSAQNVLAHILKTYAFSRNGVFCVCYDLSVFRFRTNLELFSRGISKKLYETLVAIFFICTKLHESR